MPGVLFTILLRISQQYLILVSYIKDKDQKVVTLGLFLFFFYFRLGPCVYGPETSEAEILLIKMLILFFFIIIVMEYTGAKWKTFLGQIVQVGFGIGGVWVGVAAYFIRSWVPLQLVLHGLGIFVLAACFW